jgi:hypothetical protein
MLADNRRCVRRPGTAAPRSPGGLSTAGLRNATSLEHARDGLAAITAPPWLRAVHTAALRAFQRQADEFGLFLYEVDRKHVAVRRAAVRLGRRLSAHSTRDQRVVRLLRAMTRG